MIPTRIYPIQFPEKDAPDKRPRPKRQRAIKLGPPKPKRQRHSPERDRGRIVPGDPKAALGPPAATRGTERTKGPSEVRAPDGAQTPTLPSPHQAEEQAEQAAIAQVEAEVFGREVRAPNGADNPDRNNDAGVPWRAEFEVGPEYRLLEVDPRDLVVPLSDQRDGTLLSAVVRSLETVGIVIPPMVIQGDDGRLAVMPGQGRTRVLWAVDRGLPTIRVVEVQCNGIPAWLILREVAIEDIKKRLTYEQTMEWIRYFRPYIDKIHSSQMARRKLLADAQRSRTMLARKSGKPTDEHKYQANQAESWQSRKFGDPVEDAQGRETAFAKSARFKYPLTVSLFFREAISESTARRAIRFDQALRSPDAAIKRVDLPNRLGALADGEFSAAGIEQKLRSVQRIELLKRKIREQLRFDDKDTKTAIRWIFERIRLVNTWAWDSVNRGFGTLRRPAHAKRHFRETLDLTQEEAQAYVYGEYPGADVPLNLMTYLTKPGDLVVDFFAGSGATKDAAEHFLDPRWRSNTGQWIWWNHRRDELPEDRNSQGGRNLDLTETVFPPDYWNVDHRRRCLQFDVEPNPLALADYGTDFILQHDVVDGITDGIVQRVRRVSPSGAALIYLDPPYLSQADYCSHHGEQPDSQSAPLERARAKAAVKAPDTNLCRMGVAEYIQVMADFIIACEQILAPDGRIALFMGTDAREGFILDPATAIFRAIQERYDRLDQVPFELDRTGPLYDKIWVPCFGYGLAPQIVWKRAFGQLANVHRHIWILRRRYAGSIDPLV